MENIIGIIGIIIAVLTFWFSFYRKPKQELHHLKVQFRTTQKISQDVQIELENYIIKTESWDLDMFPNISFRSYLNEMKNSYQENLSEELYNKLDALELTKPIIESMSKSLENQFNALQQIQIELRIREIKTTPNNV